MTAKLIDVFDSEIGHSGDIFTSTAALDCDVVDLIHNRGLPRVYVCVCVYF